MKLSEVKFKEIYCSDLEKAKETLNEIVKYKNHDKTPITYDTIYRDKSAGILEGKSLQEYKQTAMVNNEIIFRKVEVYLGNSDQMVVKIG